MLRALPLSHESDGYFFVRRNRVTLKTRSEAGGRECHPGSLPSGKRISKLPLLERAASGRINASEGRGEDEKRLAEGEKPVLEIEAEAREAGLLGPGSPVSQNKAFRSARKMLGIKPHRQCGAGARGLWAPAHIRADAGSACGKEGLGSSAGKSPQSRPSRRPWQDTPYSGRGSICERPGACYRDHSDGRRKHASINGRRA